MKVLGKGVTAATATGIAVVTIGGLIVGCGGGGVASSSAAVTTVGTTAGATLTSGTTSGSSTTSTTSGTTTGTTSGTTAGTTSGATSGTTAGSTAGTTSGAASGTTSGATSGTTTGSTSGTTTGSTSGATAGTTSGSTVGATSGSTSGTTSGTTSGSGGGTTGGTPTGLLRANAIYFGHYGDPSIVSSILSDGTGRQNSTGSGSDVRAAVPDPDNAGKYIYAALSGGTYGIYRGSTFSPANSTTLVSPQFDSVVMLQASTGVITMVALKDGASRLYTYSGASLKSIDIADSAAVSLDGTTIAYTKVVGSYENLYTYNRSSGTSALLVADHDSLFPSFSKDGAWILYSSDKDGTGNNPWDIYQIPTVGGTVQRLTNTPNVSEFGACYNESRTKFSYVAVSTTASLQGLYVASNTTATRIATDSDINQSTYWTNSTGRAVGGNFGRFQSLVLPWNR